MNLTLKPEEATLLRRILSDYLSNLRFEIVDTEDYDMRQRMKGDEVIIKSLIARLDGLTRVNA